MDIIEASHFEKLKQFILERPWWEMKLGRNDGLWVLRLTNTEMINPLTDDYMWVEKSLGEAVKRASHWVGAQHALSKRETTEVSLDEPSGDSKTLDSGTRVSDSTQDQETKCHCGREIHIYEDMNNFTRGMCLECSTVRCDLGGLCPVAVNK